MIIRPVARSVAVILIAMMILSLSPISPIRSIIPADGSRHMTPMSAPCRKIRKMEIEAALKQEMIQKGMSADDVQKVLDAGKKGKCE